MNQISRQKQIEVELENITKQLVEKYKPEKVILFGSAARGEITPDSDIDLLIIKKRVPKRGIDRKHELRSLIECHIGTDFIIYRPDEFEKRLEMGDPFLKTVIKEGKTLHG